jgi:CRISPR-associated protein Cmr4
MNARLTFIHALSPLHAGTGQGTGVIDLPIAREKATGLPFLPGSSLKGTLRARCNTNAQECRLLFGPEAIDTQTENNHASSVQFSDQRLLLLPVRSLAGTFAWVTSPYVLRRLARDIEDTQLTPPKQPVPSIQDVESCVVASEASKIKVDTSVYLEDLELKKIQMSGGKPEETWASWIAQHVFPSDTGWQTILTERFCIVHDDVFTFLLDTATEITARIKLKSDSKTVEDGGLWYEEALPTETILSGIALATPTKAAETAGMTSTRVFAILSNLTNTTLQFGGKATVGRGLCRVLLAEEVQKGASHYANV